MKFVEVVQKTVQGEGKHVGSIMSLLRFSGCNHSCCFCDTDFSEDKIDVPSHVELMDYVPMHKVMVTGGEPTIHEDFQMVVQALLSNGKEVHIESNGFDLDDWSFKVPGNVVWAVSPKLSSSGNDYAIGNYQGVKNLFDARGRLIKDCFLKFVIGEYYWDDLEEAESLVYELGISMDDVWFQSVSNDMEIYRSMIMHGPVNAHYGVQLHKFTGVL